MFTTQTFSDFYHTNSGDPCEIEICFGAPVRDFALKRNADFWTHITSHPPRPIMPPALENQNPSPLFTAAEGGRVQDVLQLLSGGANIEKGGRNGNYSPLHVAVTNGRGEVVQILLENGADVNAKTNRGYSALHLACYGRRMAGRKAIIRQLLLHGADVSAQKNENGADDDAGAGGKTPLHIAIVYHSIQVIKLLLCHGADISIKEGEGYNALHWAVQMHTVANPRNIEKVVKVIQMLLAHGNDVSAKIAHLSATTTDAGETPEQVAYTDDIKEMLRAALLRAEEARRGLLEAFTLGQHERLGAASHILPLAPEVVQMIMDRV